mmetsp:Transcript_32140/g.74039  ORF Transcript_32140/g.74039 Transcript_32140/m.74039 type:complete len:113 (+) Transcript_32140:956-1294(+)
MYLWKMGFYLADRASGVSRFKKRACKSVISMALVLVMILLAAVVWLPFQACIVLTEDNSLLPAIPYGILLVLDIYIFRSSGRPLTKGFGRTKDASCSAPKACADDDDSVFSI